MRFLSVCSGIEAASQAWQPLGWKAVAFSEIEPFPCAVLAHHYPDTPNWGDMTKYKEWPDVSIDLLCGGTPCQSFSVAGLRKGLADPRGNLMLTFGAIAAKYRPRWLVWENVPGVLSSNGGRDFGSFLGLLGELGYGFAYRVLDAQYVRVESHPRAVPQRRRRVFVVGYLGDWRRAAAVLFERDSLSGHPAPSRKAGQGTAGRTEFSTAVSSGHGWWDDSEVGATIRAQDSVTKADTLVAGTLLGKSQSSHAADQETYIPVALALRADGFDASEDGTGRGTPLIPIDMRQASRGATMTNNRAEGSSGGAPGTGIGEDGDPSPTVSTSHVPAIAFDCKASGQNGFGIGDIASTQRAMGHAESHTNGGGHQAVMTGMQVRRLTPLETERLQGFQDFYTAIPHRGKPAADGPRYKSHGNSWAINCVSWIGRRIEAVEAIQPAAKDEA